MLYCLPVASNRCVARFREVIKVNDMSTDGNGNWETQDMALAVYLRAIGKEMRAEWRDGICYWSFKDTQELRQKISEYAIGEALVEPKRYNKAYGMSKREMFAAPGNPRQSFGAGPRGH